MEETSAPETPEVPPNAGGGEFHMWALGMALMLGILALGPLAMVLLAKETVAYNWAAGGVGVLWLVGSVVVAAFMSNV